MLGKSPLANIFDSIRRQDPMAGASQLARQLAGGLDRAIPAWPLSGMLRVEFGNDNEQALRRDIGEQLRQLVDAPEVTGPAQGGQAKGREGKRVAGTLGKEHGAIAVEPGRGD